MPGTGSDNPTQEPVISDTLISPPGSENHSDRYIIAGLGGAWSSFIVGDIVTVVDAEPTIWQRYIPSIGDEVYVKNANRTKNWNGSTWTIEAGGATQLSELSDIGNSSPTKNNIFIANGTQFNASKIRDLRSLAIDRIDTGFTEIILDANGFPSVVKVWVTNLKAAGELREEYIYTITSNELSTLVFKIYATDGVTVLETVVYNNFNFINGFPTDYERVVS